jgi:hypothetical protein
MRTGRAGGRLTDALDPGTKAFVSYRRNDRPSAARLIVNALERRLGADNVFFDVRNLPPGVTWAQELERRLGEADIVFVVIGPEWVGLANERGEQTVLDPNEEDVVRQEIEAAMRSGALIVPVLVERAPMPRTEDLPRPFRPVTAVGAASLRNESFEDDLERLLDSLPQRLAERRSAPAPGTPVAPEPKRAVPASDVPGMPDAAHFEKLVKLIEKSGRLVPVLGSSLHDGEEAAPWRPGCGRMPNAHELARALAEEFDLPPEPADLARIAQHIVSVYDAAELHNALATLLGGQDYEPTPAHRFLARLPGLLREHGHERYQLIVTANYDTALERAFDDANEGFDVAVFIASEDKGLFLHVPWWNKQWNGAVLVDQPNSYGRFPIDENGNVHRTVIVKIHGGVLHGAPLHHRREYKAGFVITEDDYIAYLTRDSLTNLVPYQILQKLRESHYLFLGYGVRDWSLRVFLRRIWQKGMKGSAVQRGLDSVDKGFWEELDVERIDTSLDAYVQQLERHLAA